MMTKLDQIHDINILTALGDIKDAEPFNKFGYGTIREVWSTIYSAGVSPGLYPYLETQSLVAVASTDPDDTVGGSGAHSLILKGVYYNESQGRILPQREEIPLFGQTPSQGLKEFLRVFSVSNPSLVGHDLQGQGYVGPIGATWSGGEPDHILAHINDGMNRTQMMVYTCPSDRFILIQNIVITAGTGRECTIIAVSREGVKPVLSECQVFETIAQWVTDNIPIPIALGSNAFLIPPGSEFEFRGKVATGTLNVGVNMTGLSIPTRYIGKHPYPWITEPL